ncbi:MAG: superoxide dismutase family protein [Vicinamibacteraceae bacterium]
MRYLSLCVVSVSVIGIVSTAGVAKTTASGPALAAQSETAATAAADVKDAEGKSLGTAELSETPTGVIVTVKLSGIPPGEHALHLHTTGQCQAPDFKSAGGHYNPESNTHGFKSPKGTHKGDLPNVYVDADGTLNVDAFVSGVTLAPGAQSLLDDDGTAIVVHAKLDDYSTDPAGDAGDRIACGVVEKK